MKKVIATLFSIYPGEGKSALLFSVLGFLWSFTITTAVKYADASLLIHVGAKCLPTIYLLTGLGTIGIAFFLLAAFQRIETHKIFMVILFGAVAFYSGIACCLLSGVAHTHYWLWYALRVIGYIFLVIMCSCYWTFVDHYHHIQDAKRRYSLFTTCTFIGIAATGLLLHTEIIPFEHTLSVVIVGLVVTIAWIYLITRLLKPVHNEQEHELHTSQQELKLSAVFYAILRSPFTLFLTAGCFMTYLLLCTAEFNYMSSYEHHFACYTQGNANGELTHFLGKVMMGISIVSIAISLFVYPRIVRRFGATSFLLFSPVLLFLTFLGWNFSELLIFPMVGHFLDEGAVYVIEDSNLNLMLNGVPSKVKYKIRLFIESFFEPFGSLASGVLLSFPYLHSKILGLVLALVACIVALILRRYYLSAICQNITDNAIHSDRSVREWFCQMSKKELSLTKRKLLKMLSLNDPNAVSFAIDAMIPLDDPKILYYLLKLLDRQSPSNKVIFIEKLSQSSLHSHALVIEYLHRWIKNEPDPRLQSSALLHLAKEGRLSPDCVKHHISSPALILRASAIISLKKAALFFSEADTIPCLQQARDAIKKMLSSKIRGEICMGIMLLGVEATKHDIKLLLHYLKHPLIDIARAAARALNECIDCDCLNCSQSLIEKLAATDDHQLRMLCLKVLEKIAQPCLVKALIEISNGFLPKEKRFIEQIIQKMGQDAVAVLITLTKDKEIEHECRVLACRSLGKLSRCDLQQNLPNILRQEAKRAYFYYYHHHVLPDHYLGDDLALLKESLLSSYHAILDFIVQLLGVTGELQDCELLSRLIRSEHPKIRSQVIEALEKTCDYTLYHLIEPLINEIPVQQKLCDYLQKGYPAYNLFELLEHLSLSSIRLDQITAAAYMHQLELPHWKDTLKEQFVKNENIFYHFAQELIEA